MKNKWFTIRFIRVWIIIYIKIVISDCDSTELFFNHITNLKQGPLFLKSITKVNSIDPWRIKVLIKLMVKYVF